MNLKKIFFLFFLQMISLSSFAQNNAIEMADKMRSNGKIYVVVSVLIIIFTGITAFLISQEIRLRKLEKKINENFSN